jgi:hypothetical protein
MHRFVVAALLLAACTSPIEPQAGQEEAKPVPDDPDEPLELGPGELLRVRTMGGACFDHGVLVVHNSGLVTHTSYPGCMMGKPKSGAPPRWKLRSMRIDGYDLTRLLDLLADPTVSSQLAGVQGSNPGSAHPPVQQILAATPSGPLRGEIVGFEVFKKTRKPGLYVLIDELYERLPPLPP